ncbi:TIR domain-containing protein [Tardiphaga sp. 768_D3_N2_1]|uniref:TIR domain-containing protein n=1 Tax=Tardiphaga sp. 768_D3_N2_1 TaxID=3240783 RepID=UPI003F8AFF88
MAKKTKVASQRRKPIKPKQSVTRIFISHSERDKKIVDRISVRLRSGGFDVFADHFQLRPGDNFQRKISEELTEAAVVLIVLSKNSFRSEWVQQEFATIALQQEVSERQRRIVPIKIDEIPVPSYLAHLQYIDLSQDFESGLERLTAELDVTKVAPLAGGTNAITVSVDSGEAQIRTLREALRRGRLTLVCGAGVSVGAGIPAWGNLLVRLLDRLMERLSKNYSLDLGKSTAIEFQKNYGRSSSLILGKYLKNNLGDDFASETRDALYAEVTESSTLIDSIVELSRPQRDANPLDSIITFNFDCLIEEALEKNVVANKPIFSESIRHDGNELPIYHVHGYLPRTGLIPQTELVFSEDAYHSQFIEAFSWSNLIQLTKLTQNTCLFIGISLTDPNMRRLLDVAWRKNPDKTMSHFIVKRSPDHPRDSALDRVSRLLEEQDANALGLNVIWIDSFDSLPAVLSSIAKIPNGQEQ